MATNRSEQILEQIIKNGTFAPDFTIETKDKAFKVHRFVMSQALYGNPAICANTWTLLTSADIAEDLIRHSYGLQIPRLQALTGSEPNGDRIIQVLELYIKAGDYNAIALEEQCHDWLSSALASSGQKANVLVEIAEYVYKTRGEAGEAWEMWPELVGDLADSMGEILATRESLLERIMKIGDLHRRVLQELFERSEATNEASENEEE
ncbi:hypothetical protein CKM354_001156400 [Cercospora kikuchii]|uniref:BTB domain-containing protein n=1 Tax=Cercospora kikuchii TaxID=84275 RepID=A0A9P3CSH8_9PEZI|nr:uncharacterized protein CKM354_001156400 [Cercospora kikuchii]GIZ48507.1 hypothetical protein CKM354_001156400 [Cercospora kikuchii]